MEPDPLTGALELEALLSLEHDPQIMANAASVARTWCRGRIRSENFRVVSWR
jgi:hypothetical protein